VRAVLAEEGVDVRVRAEVHEVGRDDGGFALRATVGGQPVLVRAEGLLVAVGRRANTDGLGLEDLGIASGPEGVAADRRGRTSVPSIYVAGDLHGRFRYSSVARYEGLSTVRDAFFPLWSNRAEHFAWCTFTDPELAHAGLTVAEAEARFGEGVDVFRADLSATVRARIDGTRGGAILVTAKGRLVGAHLLAPRAGETIHELVLAIRQGVRLTDLATLAHVEPTYASVIDRLATDVAVERAHKLRWLARRGR
jgi:pyruvate/2-oxoglutarate dehydrogenase complex dihydrolipoamide dehydrogenase (E3) component